MKRSPSTIPLSPGPSPVRCAIYTRKSTEEGLDQSFNSLDNQRAACEAYVASQREAGWVLVPGSFDDPAYSGGNLDRPGVQRLLDAVKAGLVQVIVLHRIDRLTRSLADFSKIVEVLDAHGASFVSVTQQFNTTTSMGRLTLNVLLSFAQFERELTTERIREKIAAHKALGKWCGGKPPLGYDADHKERRLLVNEAEAALVRRIFDRYLATGSTLTVATELTDQGHTTKSWTTKAGKLHGGQVWDKSLVYKILCNRTYLGQVVHQEKVYAGEHAALITQETWDAVQARLAVNLVARHNTKAPKDPVLLQGLLTCAGCQRAMVPSFTTRKGRQYRYYRCHGANRKGAGSCQIGMVSAGALEDAVLGQVQALCQTPDVVQAVHQTLHTQGRAPQRLLLGDVGRMVADFPSWWRQLFPAEQNRLVRALVREIRVGPDGLEMILDARELPILAAQVRDSGVPHALGAAG